MDRLPETSNFYCHPGRAGGTPWLLGEAHAATTPSYVQASSANRSIR
jgi:hypothetical protein